MKKEKFEKVLLYATALLVLVLSGFVFSSRFGKPAIAYVDIGKMLDGYKFRKDMENESSKNLYQIKNVVDSLKMVQKMGPNPVVDSQILYAERAFDQYYTYSNQELTKKVWERLNPQLEEFGKQFNYQLIIGANGAGTVLYGNKHNDVTEEAIKFINGKYEKGS